MERPADLVSPKPSYRAFGTFRLVLALMVLVQHSGNLAPQYLGEQLPRYMTGSIAVLIFFILSGFVVAEAAERFYRARPGSFSFNRFMRIYPQFLLAVILSAAAHAILVAQGILEVPDYLVSDAAREAMFSLKNLALNLFYVVPLPGGANEPVYNFIPYAWAIRTEVLFYVFFSVAVSLGMMLLRLPRALALVGGLSCLLYLGWRFGGFVPDSFRFGVYFSFGVSLYYARAGSRIALWLAGGLLLASLLDFHDFEMQAQQRNIAIFGARLWLEQYAIVIGCIAVFVACSFVTPRGKFYRLDKRLGDLSYPLYLNQYTALILVASLTDDRGFLILGAAFGMAIVLSVLAETTCEPLIRPIRDRVRGARLGETAPPADFSTVRTVSAKS